MKTVLCPTRGGKASIPNQEYAMRVAREQDARLIFLYVSNVHFLDHVAAPVQVEMIEEQLDEMGEFLLVMAQERAREAGIEAPQAEVRRGEFRQALAETLEKFDVTTVVLGSGTEETGLTTPEYLTDVAKDLSSSFGVEVLLTAQGEMIAMHTPATGADSTAE